MNVFARWLAEGDLTSDGKADEVADVILGNPVRVEQLVDCINSDDPVVRGHAADAAEKIAREKPEILLPYMHILYKTAVEDPIGMVKQHLAMLFGHTAIFEEWVDPSVTTLFKLMEDQHAFTKVWAISSLCIIAELYPKYQPRILGEIVQIDESSKKSVHTRAQKAREILAEGADFPDGWVKSLAVQAMINNK